MAGTSTLRDNFTDNAIAAAWTEVTAGSATAAETGAQARFTLPSSTAGTHSAYLRSHSQYDLTADAFYINIETMVSTSVAANITFDIYLDFDNILRWTQTSGTLKAQTIAAGVTTDRYSVAWNATTYKYLRIRESGGDVLFDSSSNGTSWTNRATVAAPFAVTAVTIQFGANCGNVAAPGSFRLDDVNLILPALATTWRWTQAVWALTERVRNMTVALDTAGTAQAYVVTADGVDVNGDPSGTIRYWSGPADGGRLLTEQTSEAAAQAMAVNLPTDGRFDLELPIEARCFRLNHRSIDGSAYTLREFYPRRLVQADDIEAEAIRALHIAAHQINADHLDVIDLDATTYVTAGDGNVVLDDSGISITAGTSSTLDYLNERAYTIVTGADDVLRVYANRTSADTTRTILFDGVQGSGTDDIDMRMRALAIAGTTKDATISLTASNDTFEATLFVKATATAEEVVVTAAEFNVNGGVNVGVSVTGATTGQIKAGGRIITTGASGALQFDDRTGSEAWAWYGTSSIARLSDGAGDRLTVTTGGVVNISGSYQVDGTQVVTNRRTGWSAPTGTAQRSTFATDTVTLINLARAVKAVIDDLTTHGLLGA